MFAITGLLSILSGILLYDWAAFISNFSMAFLYSDGLTLAGAAVLIVSGMGIAGIFSLFSKNGRRKVCMIIAAVFYMVPALLSIIAGFAELTLWVSLCILMGSLYILWIFLLKYAPRN